MQISSRFIGLFLFFVISGWCGPAQAQETTCLKDFFKSKDSRELGFDLKDVEKLVNRETTAFGISSQGIRVIPCSGVDKVRSSYVHESAFPKSDYIFYDPTWVREVLGPKLDLAESKRSHDEAMFLFGHEIGHILSRHFTSALDLRPIEKERNADLFAACVVGALDADWENISNFIKRVRAERESTYPSAAETLQATKPEFEMCRARVTPLPPTQSASNQGLPLFEKMPTVDLYRYIGNEIDLLTNLNQSYGDAFRALEMENSPQRGFRNTGQAPVPAHWTDQQMQRVATQDWQAIINYQNYDPTIQSVRSAVRKKTVLSPKEASQDDAKFSEAENEAKTPVLVKDLLANSVKTSKFDLIVSYLVYLRTTIENLK